MGYVSPAAGTRGTHVTVYGRNLGNVSQLRFARAGSDGAVVRTCRANRTALTAASPAGSVAGGGAAELVSCTVPSDLPYGMYNIILSTDAGDVSIDPYQVSLVVLAMITRM